MDKLLKKKNQGSVSNHNHYLLFPLNCVVLMTIEWKMEIGNWNGIEWALEGHFRESTHWIKGSVLGEILRNK